MWKFEVRGLGERTDERAVLLTDSFKICCLPPFYGILANSDRKLSEKVLVIMGFVVHKLTNFSFFIVPPSTVEPLLSNREWR
jgi:hypothetical protein